MNGQLHLRVCAFVLLYCFFAVCVSAAANASPLPVHFNFVPVVANGTATQVFDVGVVSDSASPTISHRYILENDSPKTLTIAKIVPTGSGIAAALDNHAKPAGFTVAPGDLVGITLTATVPRKAGDFTAGADVYVTGQPESAATVEIVGTSDKGYALATRRINFGAVEVGASSSRPIYVLVTPAMLASKEYPVVVSDDDEIRVTAPDGDLDPASVKGLTAPKSLGAGARVLQWTATFSPKAIAGEVTKQLWLAPTDRSLAPTADPHISITAHASSTAEIAIALAKVDFGDKVRGTDWNEWVLIRASSPSVFHNLKFDAGSIYLQLDLVDPASHVSMDQAQKLGDTAKYLQIILSAVAPVGKLQAIVTVSTPSGKTFSLPVTANVLDVPSNP